MFKSIEVAKMINELRTENGLSELEISDRLTANAMAQATYGTYLDTGHWSKCFAFAEESSAEIKAWTESTSSLKAMWYTQEKNYYDFKAQYNAVKAGSGYDTSYKYYQQIVDGISANKDVVTLAKELKVYAYSSSGSTGHYEAIVSKSATEMGASIAGGYTEGYTIYNVSSAIVSFGADNLSNDSVTQKHGETHTVNEYETMLRTYISDIANSIEDAKKALEEATKAYHLAVGHTWNLGEVTKKATCTETGIKTYTCTECGETKTETINKLNFADVDETVAHNDDIDWLAEEKISEGWRLDDDTKEFRPLSEVKRCDMAAFIRRLAINMGYEGAESYTPSEEDLKIFKDVDEGTSHYVDVLWLAHEGISTGWDVENNQKEFRPMDNVTRADMAAFLKRFATKMKLLDSITWTSSNTGTFKDIDSSVAHNEDIEWLAHSGISTGWEVANNQKEFRPLNNVARADMAAFLHRLANLS